MLFRSLLLALVVVAPFWIWQKRRLRKRRAERNPPETTVTQQKVESSEVSAIVANIGEIAKATRSGDATTVQIPTPVTQNGTPVDSSLADALIRDALRRSDLYATAEIDTGNARIIECKKA